MKARIEGDKLIIEIDLEEPRLSSTKKMKLIASSGGWQKLKVEGAPEDYAGEQIKANVTVGFRVENPEGEAA